MVPFFAMFMLNKEIGVLGQHIALALFCIASLTDCLDGYIARKYNLITNFGKFMDPLADKLLVCSALVCLSSADRLSPWVTLIIIAREFIISGFRLVASDNDIVIAASVWGKFKTISQMVMIILLILNSDDQIMMFITDFSVVVSVVLTIVSLVDYMWKNKQVLLNGKM
jgi:CDP-diacylglycerol--glycerol-3-phosphate 3-phosphatidyltransferase